MGWINVILRAMAWVGTGYMANDAIEAYKESKEAGQPVGQIFQEKLAKYQQKDFLIKLGILAAGVAAGMVATMTASKKKKLGLK